MELINSINAFFRSKTVSLVFNYKRQKITIIIPVEYNLKFENNTNNIFGWNFETYQGTGIELTGDKTVKSMLNVIKSLYVYSDIVDHQYIGDESAPLLRFVAVEEQKDVYIDCVYDSPHYVPVIRNSIETIEIDIRSNYGEKIKFQSGHVLVKLHFRRKNLYQ
jgi:uncharacterized protein YccT (UPF0319 family)